MAATADPSVSSWADAERVPYWLVGPGAPEPADPFTGVGEADLAIVGGGFTGLWAAIQAKEIDPGRDVVLLERDTIAFGASGRNGGFCDASLTHGLANGIARFPEEMPRLEELAHENFAGLTATVRSHAIDCDWNPAGFMGVATEPHQAAWLREAVDTARSFGHEVEFLDRDAVRAQVDSPTYLAGLWRHDDSALVDPARLAWGLRRVALALGVRIHERTEVTGLEAEGDGATLRTCGGGVLRANRVILATNAFPPLARSIKRYIIPVYDYVLMTEPLSPAQREAIGWRQLQGLADSGNQFHYYRLTDDGRILWGGYDAIYHYGNKVAPELEDRPETFTTLARNFLRTFPQLEGIRFSHRWAGAIDTCSRFTVMWGTALGGRASYAVGYTGLGVGATRFGARVALDLIGGEETELTKLRFVRSRPVAFPPEPIRYAGIQITRRALARADRRQGKRGPWLKLLDALGLGFDS
jgi:glycine/D-amino acid oxidase-like deaminating enzyme